MLLIGPVLPLAAAELPTASAAPAAQPVRFDIDEYFIQGNSVLSLQAIEDAVGPFLGPGRGVDDVDRARVALETAYRNAGFKTVSVTIPRQPPGGVIRLDVVENSVGHLTVVGSRYHSADHIVAEAPSLAEGRVPDFDAVQRDVEALNRQADRRVTPALKAGATPGTVDVDLVVDDDLPLHGSLELNNRRSEGTHALRTIATLSYDNLWQAAHSATLSVQVAPQRTSDAKVVYGAYLARFGSSQYSVLGNVIHSDSNLATVGGTTVIGRGNTFGLRGLMTLPSSDRLYQSASIGVDYKDLRNSVSLASGDVETPIHYAPFSLGYNATLRDDGRLLSGALTFSIADPHIGSSSARLDDNRYRARGQQAALRGNAGWTQDLPSNLQAYLRAGGQWTDQPLVTSEQFGLGGEESVRGYEESEALGDYGLSAGLELRGPPLLRDLTAGGTRVFDDSRPFLFVDGGQVRLKEALPEQQSRYTLASAGIGLRFSGRFPGLAALDGVLEYARVLRDGPNTADGGQRVLFRLTGSF